MRRRCPVAQGGSDPDELIPLLANEREVNRATDDGIETPIGFGPVELGELLLTHVESGHQAIAQEMTEAKQLIGVAVGVDKMFLGSQDRVVIEESVEHINGLADGTGDHLRVELSFDT